MAVSVLSAEERRRERARIWASAPRKSTGTEIVLLSCYGDESADQKQARVFAVAGVVGRELDWREVEAKWIERTGGEIFHATDCERQEGGKDLYKDLVQIIAGSRLGIYGCALDIGSFRKWLPEMRLDDACFYSSFLRVVQFMTENAATRLEEPIEFTFHTREKSEYNCGQLYESMVSSPEMISINNFMGSKISFESNRNPRIQIADLAARETMKSLDNQLMGIPPRKSMLALFGEGKRGRIDILGDDWWSGLRAEAENRKIGEQVGAWMDRHNLPDTMSNRIRYLALVVNSQKAP